MNVNNPPILVLTTEPLPICGKATTGAGLRAWGLFMALRHNGLHAVIGTPAYDHEDLSSAKTEYVEYFHRGHLDELLNKIQPRAVVLQHWGLASELPPLTVPLAIDLAGPHLLERVFWGTPDKNRDLREKLSALRSADFVTASGYYQRHYFYPFLSMAGFDLRNTVVPVIPFSVPPPNPDMPEKREPYSFIYGGTFLAWQNPDAPIRWLLDEMDKQGKGKLYFFGGCHPVIDASGGRFADLSKYINSHPRVVCSGIIGFDKLMQYYRKASVALDLMAFNPERELAYTTRTMIYLHCGLPVIHNDYSELGQLIRQTQSGWALSPDDEAAFRGVIRSILNDTAPLPQMGMNALELAKKHDWTQTAEPLISWCKNPTFRPGKTSAALQWEAREHELDELRTSNRTLKSELETLQGKYLVKLICKIPSLSFLLSPLVWFSTRLAVIKLNRLLSKTICQKGATDDHA